MSDYVETYGRIIQIIQIEITYKCIKACMIIALILTADKIGNKYNERNI